LIFIVFSEEIPSEELPVEEHGFITLGASSPGDILLAGAAHGKLYYSDDGGVTWFTLEGFGTEEYWSGATVSADGQEMAMTNGSTSTHPSMAALPGPLQPLTDKWGQIQ